MLSVVVPSRSAVRRLALARAISTFGSTSAYVALASVVYARTGSPVWVSAVAFASFATPALSSPVAGALADRHDRRAVMVCSDLLGALCFLSMALASGPAVLVGIKVAAALAAAPLIPASSAALPGLAPKGELSWANSAVAVGGTVGALSGPLAGGVLVATSGGSAVFLLNTASFLISALLLATLRPGPRAEPRVVAGRSARGGGFARLRSDPVLRRLAIGTGLVSLGIGTTLPAELPLVAELGAGPAGYGALVAVWGVGGLLGARLAGGLLRESREAAILGTSFAGVACSLLAVGLAPFLAAALFSLAFGGAAEGVGEVARQLILQRRAPDAVRGRVVAAAEAIAQGGLAISLLFAGFVAAAIGPRGAFAAAAGLCALGAFTLVWSGGATFSPPLGGTKRCTLPCNVKSKMNRLGKLMTMLNPEKTRMPSPEEALPGRSEPAFDIAEPHAVLGSPLKPPFPDGIETAYFALGCFWGAERLFWVLDGVYTTAVGYMNGTTPNPTYEEVCSGKTGHAEAVLVAFDPERIAYADLLKVFFEEHDPTQGMRQGNDVGTQYRSGIYFVNDSQKAMAEAGLQAYDEALRAAGHEPITTEVEPAGPFYYAEDYHQQYLHKVPNGYCGLAGTGVSCRIPAPSQ